ncbi:MAG: restriction endonuclease subunit S [Pseudomonadota bacterium]
MAEAVAMDMSHTSEAAEVPAGYRRTQIGIIPQDWELKPIGELLEFKNGLNKAKQYFGYGTPIINYMDVFEHTGIRQEHVAGLVDVTNKEKDSYSARKGDVLFTRTSETLDEIGYASVVLEDIEAAVFSGFVLRGRPKSDELRDDYKRYCFRSEAVREQIVSKGTYTTRALTNGRALSSVLLPFPPDQDEQAAVAGALKDQDQLISDIKRLIEKKRKVREGSLQELVNGKRRLSGFSKKWEEKSFGEVFSFGSTATNSRADLASSGDLAYVHYGDIHTIFHSHLDFQSQELPRIDSALCPRATPLRNGDWLMADASEDVDGVGKAVEVLGLDEGERAVSGLHTFLLREKLKTFAPGFKGHLGNSDSLKKQYQRVMTGMKVFGVSKAALKDLVVPVPDWDEQVAIAKVLNELDSEIYALEQQLFKTTSIRDGMTQNLLIGRVRLV